jgi:hypothetical protein
VKNVSGARENLLTNKKICAEGARSKNESEVKSRDDRARHSAIKKWFDLRRAMNKFENDEAREDAEESLQDVSADGAEAKETGDRPAGGESGADDLGPDQNRRADDRDDVGPVRTTGSAGYFRHVFAPNRAGGFALGSRPARMAAIWRGTAPRSSSPPTLFLLV